MKITKQRLRQIIKEEIGKVADDNYAPQFDEDTPSPKEGRRKAHAEVRELMRSGLFSQAGKNDMRNAARRIVKALVKLEPYGGEEPFYEEVLDDALGGADSPMVKRLADAAGIDHILWGEALAAWLSGDEDFMMYIDADHDPLQREF